MLINRYFELVPSPRKSRPDVWFHKARLSGHERTPRATMLGFEVQDELEEHCALTFGERRQHDCIQQYLITPHIRDKSIEI